MLGVGTASEMGKAAAYAELNKIVQGLARRQTWKQLNERTVTGPYPITTAAWHSSQAPVSVRSTSRCGASHRLGALRYRGAG